MNEPLPIDLFATKSIEYVLVLGFLTTLVVFWRLMRRVPAMVPTRMPAGPHASTPSGWFQLPLERCYHPGHGWAQPDEAGLVGDPGTVVPSVSVVVAGLSAEEGSSAMTSTSASCPCATGNEPAAPTIPPTIRQMLTRSRCSFFPRSSLNTMVRLQQKKLVMERLS